MLSYKTFDFQLAVLSTISSLSTSVMFSLSLGSATLKCKFLLPWRTPRHPGIDILTTRAREECQHSVRRMINAFSIYIVISPHHIIAWGQKAVPVVKSSGGVISVILLLFNSILLLVQASMTTVLIR